MTSIFICHEYDIERMVTRTRSGYGNSSTNVKHPNSTERSSSLIFHFRLDFRLIYGTHNDITWGTRRDATRRDATAINWNRWSSASGRPVCSRLKRLN